MWVPADPLYMSADRQETERATVRTYVPTYQKEKWEDQADSLEMSLSEFVRTMVQAGRADFEVPDRDPDRSGSSDADPGGDGLETMILDALDGDAHLSWDQLVDRVAGDMEDRIDETLDELQRENRVTYSGRNGGYTILDD